MSRRALLTGVVGGIIGTATSAFGIAWIFILNTLQSEISYYVFTLGCFLTSVLGTYTWGGIPPLIYQIPYFPSWSLFGVSSFILTVFLIVTGILIGVGFYGTYKIGGGAMGVVGLVFGVIGVTLGALLIIMANLTTGYNLAQLTVGMGEAGATLPFYPVPTPNFLLIVIGFFILGVTFILLGSASIAVREMTEKPDTSYAAGILSIIGAVAFIMGGLSGYFSYWFLAIGGFGLIFVAFILWTVIFYSSRNI